MNYPLSESNWICRLLGHRYGPMYEADGMARQTCWLDGKTIPPFRPPVVSRDVFHGWYTEWLRTREAAELERRAWLEELAGRWGLVRAAESLTADELERQAERCDRALGHMFYRTYPRPGFTVTVPRDYFAAAVGGALEPGGLLRILTDALIAGTCTNLQREPDDPYDPHDDPPFTVVDR